MTRHYPASSCLKLFYWRQVYNPGAMSHRPLKPRSLPRKTDIVAEQMASRAIVPKRAAKRLLAGGMDASLSLGARALDQVQAKALPEQILAFS